MGQTEPDETDIRRWNWNAHYAWSLTMWGSGEHARQSGSMALGFVGFYYAAFHAAFSVACTDTSIALEDYERVDHGTVHRWTNRLFGVRFGESFDKLRRMREGLNYLGMESALKKFLFVQGRLKGFVTDGKRIDFPEALLQSADLSREFVLHARTLLEAAPSTQGSIVPRIGDRRWQDEVLQDDLLLSAFPSVEARRAVLALGFSLLK